MAFYNQSNQPCRYSGRPVSWAISLALLLLISNFRHSKKKRPVSIRLDPKEIIAIYISCVNPRSLVKSSQVSLLNANIKQERDDESGICCFNCPPYMYLTCVQFQLHVLCIQSIKLCGRLDFTLLILLSSTSFASVFYKQERVDERLSTRSNQV